MELNVYIYINKYIHVYVRTLDVSRHHLYHNSSKPISAPAITVTQSCFFTASSPSHDYYNCNYQKKKKCVKHISSSPGKGDY